MGVPIEVFWNLFLISMSYWWVIIPTTIFGLIIGAVPGFGPQNSIIILLPLTLVVSVELALTFMVALYVSARTGGGIPAILINIPGTAGAGATPLDGYPMTKAGRAEQALTMCFVASTVGGLITCVVTLLFLPGLNRVGLHIHSVEMVVIMLFGLTLIAVISAQDTLKGLIAGFFGLLIGSIGPDHIYAAPRATFGFLELYDGVPLVPTLIGLFAISEALIMIEQKMIVTDVTAGTEARGWGQVIEGLRMSLKRWWHIVWTSLIGLFVGVLPGAGANIAGFVAYQQSRLFSKTPELYGTGHPEGLLAPESANNGVTAGTLVPLLTLGIPGGATAAVMLIVLQFHGVPLGPKLFMDSPELAYGVIMTMFVCYLFMALTIIPLARYLSWVVLIPTQLLAPLIIAFTLVGAFAPREYLFDMGLALVFGLIGYLARKTGYQTAAILIGVVLGPLVEQNYLRALRLAQGDLLVLFSSRLGNILWAFLFISVAYPFVMDYLKRRARQAN